MTTDAGVDPSSAEGLSNAETESVAGPVADLPVGGRELIAVVLWTALADLLIFRTLGYSGPGIFFVIAPILLYIVKPRVLENGLGKTLMVAMMVVSARLIWLGGPMAIFSAMVLTIAFSIVGSGGIPLVLEGVFYGCRLFFDGFSRVGSYRWPQRARKIAESQGGKLAVVFPVVAAIVFGSVFVFANPDLLSWVGERLSHWSSVAVDWMTGVSAWELPFVLTMLFLGVELMRPSRPLRQIGASHSVEPMDRERSIPGSPWYFAYRNTLVTLIVMFAAYLTFEFSTLFGRRFPEGFYYAGYAHQGAAWLTFALALATGLLSMMFQRSMLQDARLPVIRKLAWAWSGLNGLLAVAVYNRLMIYVGYNGMTRMRMIGFFGITVVVVGFGFVIYKIAKQRSFWWLIRAQLVALMIFIMAHSVFPIDYVVHRYNAMRVNHGYLHPAVMIAVKPTSDEGYFPLFHLTDHPDPTIQSGVQAMLADRLTTLEQNGALGQDGDWHWTQYQGASRRLLQKLRSEQAEWQDFRSPRKRRDAIKRFRDYAMQWY